MQTANFSKLHVSALVVLASFLWVCWPGSGLAKSLNPHIDTTTRWTADTFKKYVVHSGKISFVHWKYKDYGNNKSGDRFFNQVIKEYGDAIEQFIVIKTETYPNEGKELRIIPSLYNDDKNEGPIEAFPSYSIFLRSGEEIRVRGPPAGKEGYEKKYERVYKPGLDKYIRGVGRN
ncbi:MAG: hypothetical protein H6907_09715 [Hyphomicrobiales bacterium]|nr:hypothetical protein [Hyphomicrobiales bacterium]MCP5371996.1 hypothetical protein [Hyphomicrobiales bacterium]